MNIPFLLALYSNKKIGLNWSAEAGADGYEVTVFGAGGSVMVAQKTASDVTSLELKTDDYPFKTGGIYFAAVRCWAGGQPGSWCEAVELAINDLVLPINKVTCEAGTVLGAVTNPGADASVYTFQIQEKPAAVGNDVPLLAEVITGTKGLPVAVSNQVTIGKTYQVRSKLWFQNAVTAWTDYSEIQIVEVPRPDVTVTYDNKTIHCVWPEVTGMDGYQLELWTTGSNPTRIFQKEITAAPFAVDIQDGVEEDKEYEVRLRSFKGLCYSVWDGKEIYTSTLSPVLKALYDRLLQAYHASGDQSLSLDATTLGDPAAGVITLFKNELEAESILLSSNISIVPDPQNDQVLVSGVTTDPLLGIASSSLSMAFSTDATKVPILICLHLPTGSDWQFTQSFPTLSTTYLDEFTFDISQESLPDFVLCSVDQPGTALKAGLNFEGNIEVTGPLAVLTALISNVGSTVSIVGTMVREENVLTIELKGRVPDVTLNLMGFQPLVFAEPAFVFYVRQDVQQSYIRLVRWVESDVTLSSVSIPLAVQLPDAISGWAVMLTPGKTMPLGNVPSFLGFIVGLDLSALLPDAIQTLDCFVLDGFRLSFDKDKVTPNNLSLSIDTNPERKALWTILPCLVFDRLCFQLEVFPTSSSSLGYRADILGSFKLNETLVLQAEVILPLGAGEWVFSCYTLSPMDSLTALSSLMNGADLGQYLPAGLKDIGKFELSTLVIAFDPAQGKLTRLGIAIGSAAPWVLLENRLVVQRIYLEAQVQNPFSDNRTVTGMVQGCLSIGQGGILATIGKEKADAPWLFTVELVPGTMITMADMAGLAGITQQDIESFLPSQLSVLGLLGLTQFYLEYDLTAVSLNNVSFTIALTAPWNIYKDMIAVTSSSLSMSITPATATNAFAITAYIDGTIKLGQVAVVLSATNDQPNANWVFTGALDDGSSIVFDDIFTEVGLNGLPVPYSSNFPRSITITTLEASITPAIPKFYFHAASVFEWDMSFALVTLSVKALSAELSLDNPAGEPTTIYLFKAGGSFVFCKINTELALQITNGDQDSLLYATLTNENAKEVSVSEMSDTLTTNQQQGTPWNQLPLPTDLSAFGYVSAKLLINLTKNTYIMFGTSDKFGSIGFLVKKLDENNWGYFVGLALAENFTFASICTSLSIIDSILSIRHAGFSVCSFEAASVQELTAGMPEFKEVVVLPEGSNPAPIKPGLTIYGTIVFKGDLFGNILKVIIDMQEDSGITIYAFISKQPGQSIFKATIGTFSLFQAIVFKTIELTYQPQDPKDPTITNILLLSGTIQILIDDYNKPTFTSGMSFSSQKASFSLETSEAIHSPWAMFNATLEGLCFDLQYTFGTTTTSTISLTGTMGFGVPDPQGQHSVVLDGCMLFDAGSPVVCALSLAKPLTIDDFLVTILPNNLWPTGWLKITFKEGGIYYAQKAGTYFGKTYRQGYNIDSTIDVYGFVFIIGVQVRTDGLVFTGKTNTAIDLIFAKLTAQDFSNTSPELEITTVGNDKKFGFLLGVQLFGENIGTAEILYSITNQQFEGKVTYNGTILGTQNPYIKFAWNKDTGFQIQDMPLGLLSTVYDYGKKLDQLSSDYSSGSCCEKLIGMAFKELVKTNYSVNVVSDSIVSSEDKVTIPLQITCTVQVAGKDILSQSIQLPLEIVKPRETSWQGFLDCLFNSVVNSADAIVKRVLLYPDDFVKFIAAAGLEKMAQKTLVSLMCREVKSDQVEAQSETEVSESVGESAEVAGGAEAGAAAAEAAATAAAAAVAGEVAVDAVPVVAVVVAGIAALAGGLLTLFGVSKSKEQKEAEANQKRTQEAAERVRKTVEAKLKLSDPTMVYQTDDTIAVGCQPVAGGGNLTYTFELYKDGNKIATQAQSETSYVFANQSIEPGATYKVTAQASLQAKTITYTGAQSQQSLNVPAIPQPEQLVIVQIEDHFMLTWKSGGAQSQTYRVRVRDLNGQVLNPQPPITISGTQAMVDASALTKGTTYQFQVRAISSDGQVFSRWCSVTSIYSALEAPKQVLGTLFYAQDASITLKSSWQAATGVDHYAAAVFDGTHQPVMPPPVVLITGCTAAITSPTFVPGITLYWRMGSQNADSTQTVWSPDQEILLIDLPVPQGVKSIFDANQEAVTATWQADVEAKTYDFQLLDDTGQPVGGIQHELLLSQATVKGPGIVFGDGKVYRAQAKAFADHSETDWSVAVPITVVHLLAPQTLALVYDFSDQAVHATWQGVPQATVYEFELQDDQGTLVGQIQTVSECKAAVGGKDVPLQAGKMYQGMVRARTSDCLGLWSSPVSIVIPNDPAMILAVQLKNQGYNMYQAAERIAQQLPSTQPVVLARDLYAVFQPPYPELNDLAWGLWFGLVKEQDAKPALKDVYPSSTDDQLNAAVQQAWHPTPNDLAAHLKLAGYAASPALEKMRQTIQNLSINTASVALSSATYPLLDSANALNVSYKPVALDLVTAVAGGFQLINTHGIAPMGAAMRNGGVSLSDTSAAMKLVYKNLWTIDTYNLVLTIYNSDQWGMTIDCFNQQKRSDQAAVTLKQAYPQMPVIDMDVMLAAVFDLYPPHVSVQKMAVALKAAGYSLSDAAAGMKLLYQPDWTTDDYQIVLAVYNQ